MKRSRTLWVLVAFFVWAALKSVGSMVGADSQPDYALLNAIGAGKWFYVTSVPLLLGETAMAFLLFQRRAAAYLVGSCLIAMEAITGAVTMAVAAAHPGVYRAIYVAVRQARGQSISADHVASATSPNAIVITGVVYVLFWALIFYYLRRVKPELSSGDRDQAAVAVQSP